MNSVISLQRASLVAACASLALLSACTTTPCKAVAEIPTNLLVRPQEPVLLQTESSTPKSKTAADGKPAATSSTP